MFRALPLAIIALFVGTGLRAGDGFTTNSEGQVARIPWNDSQVVGSPEPPPPYQPVRVYEQLPMQRPVYVKQEPGTDRMILLTLDEAERGPATLRAFVDRPDVTESERLMDCDRQILGFTFHPN